MGKRKSNAAIVISSSDDEGDKDFTVKSNLSYSKSKSICKPASVPRTNPKKAKMASLSNSCSRKRKDSNANDFDEIERFCKEFDEGITRFNVSTGSGRSKDLWADKYRPLSLEELAVHKKKVEEVKALFEERLTTTEGKSCNPVILISGPAGVGKSATVHAIASYFGATVCEWNTPTPTIWQEHLHNSDSGLRYTSKLDEFEHFVEKIRKYGLFLPSMSGGSRPSFVLLIDDLPVVNGKAAYRRLHRCLLLLVRSVCVPTAILITDYGKAEFTDYTMRYWEEIQLSLQDAGACKVTFNPITVNSMKKTLSIICREEQCEVSAEQIDLIAKSSEGDIRNAIISLQYFCLKPNQGPSNGFSQISNLCNQLCLSFGRDDTISLFHALGKFLHNKRESKSSIASDSNAIILKEKFVRLPLKMDAPETVLLQAHGQARPIADFLHENVLDFISEDAINDAWVVGSYLSDTDLLLASLNGMVSRNFEAENAVQAAATSVAVRGVLFGNSHLVPSRWHAIRRPKLWQVEQSLLQNKFQMVNQRRDAFNGLTLPDLSVVVTEFSPILKWIGHGTPEDSGVHEASANDMVEDDLNGLVFTKENEMTSEDEIEDW